ncbi:MAG: sulfatase-like hydrolase/transferase [Myxococcales bacterium]|nr:sulfatase-like hydrolase/transferase [Myxococcales bacterium]
MACAPAGTPPNVLLLVSDTLRGDAIDCAAAADRTPNLCALAARGVTFERAYANAPWTPPSSVALLTGRHPAGYSDAAPDEPSRKFHVAESEQLLGEDLAARGYTPLYDVENALAVRSGGLQGFTELHGRPSASKGDELVESIPGDEPRYRRMRDLVRFLLAAEEPFFLVRWILDPHAPYAAPERFLEPLRSRAAELPEPLEFYAGLGHKRAAHRLREVAPELGPAELELLRALYHREVASVDERVGYALDALRKGGLERRTLVVFTSDHGEGFGEHGIFLHGKSFHEELVRVPLIVAGPGISSGLATDVPVSLVDIAATLYEWLGVEPAEPLQGRSFAALASGAPDGPAPRRVYLSSSNGTEYGLDALIEGTDKLVRLSEGAYQLFDLAGDPGEREDLAAARPERVAELAATLEAVVVENEARRARNLNARDSAERVRTDAETEDALRALGYVE